MEKILTYYKDAKALIHGGMIIPRMISFWPSHTCNLNCNYCHYSDLHGEKVFMDVSKFKVLVGEVAALGVRAVEFSGGGEPCLHKGLSEMMEGVHSKGLSIGLFTNGTMLDFDTIKYCKYVRVGLDAVDSVEYTRLKRRGTFGLVVENIKKIVEKKKEDSLRIPRCPCSPTGFAITFSS